MERVTFSLHSDHRSFIPHRHWHTCAWDQSFKESVSPSQHPSPINSPATTIEPKDQQLSTTNCTSQRKTRKNRVRFPRSCLENSWDQFYIKFLSEVAYWLIWTRLDQIFTPLKSWNPLFIGGWVQRLRYSKIQQNMDGIWWSFVCGCIQS